MRAINFISLSLILISLFSCQNTPQNAEETSQKVVPERIAPNAFVASLEKAHHTSEVLENEVIAFDLKIIFGEKERFNGTIYSRTDSVKIKMKRKSDGAELLFDGKKHFIYPDTTEWSGARFSIFTWQYFFMAPFKLNDIGTKWELTGEKLISGLAHETGKLSFEAGIGDAPDDWYLVYQNPKEKTMAGMAYIVTAGGRSQEEAEKSAHAIYYRDYQKLSNGIPMSSNWDFYNWNKEEGFNGEPIGTAAVSNVRLIKKEGTLFEVPAEAKELSE